VDPGDPASAKVRLHTTQANEAAPPRVWNGVLNTNRQPIGLGGGTMSRRITQNDLDAEIRSYLVGLGAPEPASLGEVLHRLPERAGASHRWSPIVAALVGSAALAVVLVLAVAGVGLPFIPSGSGQVAPAATPGPPGAAAPGDLRTFDVPEPCTTTVDPGFTTTQCASRYQLAPGTLVVSISSNGNPGFDMTASRPAGSTARCKSKPTLFSTTRTKLILKGIDPDGFNSESPDDPAMLARVRQVAAELNVSTQER
jgi:hypothetical protein